MMLTIDNLNANMLCFTEHWLCEDQMNVLNLDQFKLVSKFCRSSSASGCSCIFTKNTLQTKEINYLSSLGSVKVFEVSAVELADFDIILACIYRSPDSDFYEFVGKLETLITRVFSKGKRLILYGDLNINILQHSGKLQELLNLLTMNNLINVVKFPTRITSHTKSLIDVVIVDNTKDDMLIKILDMGYSDHLAQFFCMKSKKIPKGPLRIIYQALYR